MAARKKVSKAAKAKTPAKRKTVKTKPVTKAKAKPVKKNAAKPKPTPKNRVTPVPAKRVKRAEVPVVGIGASAGGLEAFEKFFKAMPDNNGMGFVLVPHLDPTHISILPELLQKYTKMKVYRVEEGMKVQPNSVYVIPPNKYLAILHHGLHLLDQGGVSGSRLPVDFFFRSLAQDQKRNAIGIVFSGTGSDGTLGIKEIRSAGGLVIAQDTKSAKYDGMPRSAEATGLVDFMLPPEEMPEKLIRYTRHSAYIAKDKIPSETGKVPNALQRIFALLQTHTGHDFSLYKHNTLCRRIERRMNVHQVDDIAKYVRYLEANPHELDILFKDVLIGVTNFFREPESFEALKKKVLLPLLEEKPNGYMLRVWVAGCSTGEEAYSIAILIQECMHELKKNFKLQIFGTDIDEDAVVIARQGIYPASISADVHAGRLEHYFIKEKGAYRIKKDIREMFIFAPQNIINDPPFTKLDLLSCRNLLIYLGPELQKKLVPVFHYSLKPGGTLMLGSSETIGGFVDMFSVLDKKWRVFKSRETAASRQAIIEFPYNPRLNGDYTERPQNEEKPRGEMKTSQLVEQILLKDYAPPCAIINAKKEIVYIHGHTGKYLEPAPGAASLNILEMARPGLKMELASAIRRVSAQKEEVVFKGLSTWFHKYNDV